MNWKRFFISLITGAVLGVFCIIGVGLRLGFADNTVFLAATWFNRLLMGIMIGCAGDMKLIRSKANIPVRGLLLGTVVSFAWFISTHFRDPVGFAAGIIYGLIIDLIASYTSDKNESEIT